ncbi:MAG: hypothetical protein UX10_C0015G0002 [Candidatus Magasanikbacteria bacterium GW2011_GWA2_45_39]|uniref:Uncharacterized protein n=2 Tax=Candidatus Magasanikiibacteriota TaxID=1752731 RepID=A0A0G1QXB2_9BACT|nr:MAG: hypothetical protein UX10_C0015G0002 [Candidatus Magasanikbacteria bacterium GW2011_GWA2_45_39]KKU13305.1 MAG: hypothetical protein UX20_C0025G0005 [Candidatus Magasanikbacteria bacterium GW2011_GWC2_45_8]HBW74389.1 hypothetical protein [Candidatus Magasanikbacteria bacterium]
MKFNTQNARFIMTFMVLGLLALQIPLWQLQGSKAAFTLFDLFGPLAAAFIGTWPGIVAVAAVEVFNFFAHGARVLDAGTVIRFFPMLFAVWYFGRKNPLVLLAPLLAIISFVVHPIGRTVWYFSLYWTIPIACHFLRDHFLFARALGATFTAHAVGGALWIYVFKMPAIVWVGLIPVVARERLVFALGITCSYLVLNNVLQWLAHWSSLNLHWRIDRRYILRRLG